ncbi:hypothetical protein B0H19DRAFT_1254111 [Mycena capillaripes]|nr:hypothetical protein B0H19DRAFT_1254111 [Mycena capillaripes]
MSIAGDDVLSSISFPNPYFTPDDVYTNAAKQILIDIFREETPPPRCASLEAEIFGDESDDGSESDSGVRFTFLRRFALRDFPTRALLAGTEPDGKYARPHLCHFPSPVDGVPLLHQHHYTIFSSRLVACAGLIAAAVNDELVDAHGFDPKWISVTVPNTALVETQLLFPTVLVFLARGWQLEQRAFRSCEEAESFVEDFLEALRFGVAVLAKITISTIRLGDNAVCNPGAGIGMGREDFLQRASSLHGAIDRLDAWFDQILFSNSYIRRADIACAHLFTTQTFATFITVEDEIKTSLVPRVTPGLEHEGQTHRIHTTVANFGRQLALCGF